MSQRAIDPVSMLFTDVKAPGKPWERSHEKRKALEKRGLPSIKHLPMFKSVCSKMVVSQKMGELLRK
ncbi:MAG: hypothetical protein ACOZB3_02770 [Calditrichota bacterium]